MLFFGILLGYLDNWRNFAFERRDVAAISSLINLI